MLTRREMLVRIEQAGARGVPITNYGLCISFLHGVLDRVLSPFPDALEAFHRELNLSPKRQEVLHGSPLSD